MTLDEFLSRLNKVKRSNGNWAALCPAHEADGSKHAPSLSVTEGDDGRVLVKCHGGCEPETILVALGLELKDLFAETTSSSALTYAERTVKTHDYVDETGALLYQSVRLRSPKSFRQRRKQNGRWVWNLKETRRVLYRLPELLTAAESGRGVWVVEGEKDADALAALDMVATTNPMGADADGSKWLSEFTESFAGCHSVMLAFDCDEPGRGMAQAVARSLHVAGLKARVIDLDPERDDGYDVSDFILEHGDAAAQKLRDRARTTKRWTPGASKIEVPIVGVKHFLANVPTYDEERDYLGPFLHGGYRVHVAGPIGHGKTSFLMEATSAAVRGTEFLGWRGRGDLRALYIDLEMPPELLGQAVRDARLAEEDGFSLLTLPHGIAIDTSERDRKMLEEACEGYQIVVLDPWYKLLSDELDYSAARGVVGLLDGIRARHPGLCMLVGFHSQEPEKPSARVTLRSISGFKFFQRPADVVLTFQRIGGDESRITWVKNRSPRLKVKSDESWNLEWERGHGFTREGSYEW